MSQLKFAKDVSKQRRKKRAALYSASFDESRKKVRSHLSKELRQKLGTRSAAVRKGDKVKVMTGKHKGTSAKAVEVDYAGSRVFLEGVVHPRQAGKEVLVPFDASNLMIVETTREKKAAKAKKAQAQEKR